MMHKTTNLITSVSKFDTVIYMFNHENHIYAKGQRETFIINGFESIVCLRSMTMFSLTLEGLSKFIIKSDFFSNWTSNDRFHHIIW